VSIGASPIKRFHCFLSSTGLGVFNLHREVIPVDTIFGPCKGDRITIEEAYKLDAADIWEILDSVKKEKAVEFIYPGRNPKPEVVILNLLTLKAVLLPTSKSVFQVSNFALALVSSVKKLACFYQ